MSPRFARGGVPPQKESREPLSRSVWLTENKNPAAIFFCSLPRDGNGGARKVVEFRACQHGQKTNATAAAAAAVVVVVVFRLFQASFVWRPGRENHSRGFSRHRGSERARGESSQGREKRGRYGVAWLEKATFEYHRKGGCVRSLIRGLALHLDVRVLRSNLADKRQNFCEQRGKLSSAILAGSSHKRRISDFCDDNYEIGRGRAGRKGRVRVRPLVRGHLAEEANDNDERDFFGRRGKREK